MNLGLLYKDWWEGPVGQDLKGYLEECRELNRDVLEGIKVEEGSTDDMLRGRLAQIRNILSYIEVMCNVKLPSTDPTKDNEDDYEYDSSDSVE
jgi:hypothetical protein